MATAKKTTTKKATTKKKVAKKKTSQAPAKKKSYSRKPAEAGATGRGGARKGAGRKPGTATQRTREAANKLAGDGETPLEYMIRVMRERDDDLLEMEKNGLIDTAERIKMQQSRNARRDWAAEKAAPYMHPKLSSIEMDTNAAEHEAWLDELED